MVAIQKNPVVLDGMLGQFITPSPGMEAPARFKRTSQWGINPKVQRGGFHPLSLQSDRESRASTLRLKLSTPVVRVIPWSVTFLHTFPYVYNIQYTCIYIYIHMYICIVYIYIVCLQYQYNTHHMTKQVDPSV